MKLSVVIAAWNEEENIEALSRRLHATLSARSDAWEIVFVIEGTDRTRAIVEDLHRELGGDIRVLYNATPAGLGAAFRRGFAAIAHDADAVITMDADLNHQPEEIPHLLEALRTTGADIIVGSRFVAGSKVHGTPRWKRMLSGTMNVVMRILFALPVHDETSGFRVYRAEALRTISYTNNQFAFLPEMIIRAHRAGLRIVEEPIHFIYRREGVSKMKFWATSRSYLWLLRTRFGRK